jgi:hypothetical protein
LPCFKGIKKLPGLIFRLGIFVGVQFEATDQGIFLRYAAKRTAGAQLGNSILSRPPAGLLCDKV